MSDVLILTRDKHIADAWERGHVEAARVVGEANVPTVFYGPKADALMAALEALPLDSPAEAFDALVDAHIKTFE